jgi:hypothetical protein
LICVSLDCRHAWTSLTIHANGAELNLAAVRIVALRVRHLPWTAIRHAVAEG